MKFEREFSTRSSLAQNVFVPHALKKVISVKIHLLEALKEVRANYLVNLATPVVAITTHFPAWHARLHYGWMDGFGPGHFVPPPFSTPSLPVCSRDLYL